MVLHFTLDGMYEQSLSGSVLDSEALIAKKLAENRCLRQQIEEYHSQLASVFDYT